MMYELFEAAGVLTGVVVFGSILFSGTVVIVCGVWGAKRIVRRVRA